MTSTTNQEYIYILLCQNSKYYVGRTTNLESRLQGHFSSNGGSEWTFKYKPVKVIYKKESFDKFDELKYTLEYMEKYGVDNVRGSRFCDVELTQDDKFYILELLDSIYDRCYKCGKNGHFSYNCKSPICKRCGYNHITDDCGAITHKNGHFLKCQICEKTGHSVYACYLFNKN